MLSVLKRPVKAMFERVLAIGAERAVKELGKRGATLVLAYHNIVPDRSRRGGDTSLHLGFDVFRRQLDLLQRCTRVVALDDMVGDEVLATSQDDRPHVAISFDDAYADALAVALPELAMRDLPATVFVAPGLLGTTSTWWDSYLGTAPDEADSRRNYALNTLAGDAAAIAAYALSRGWIASAGAVIASEAELARAAMLRGITFGAHSMTHPNLARLDLGTLKWELATSLEWLRARFSIFRPWIAYPYGLSNPEVERAAEQAGYLAGFRVEGAWTTRCRSTFARTRLNVPAGVSDRGFLLRLAAR